MGDLFSQAASSRRRTVSLTLRLDQQREAILKEEAATKKITINGLVNHIIAKYLEWDRYMEKLDGVTITAGAMAELVNLVDEAAFAELARKLAEDRRRIISFWYKQTNPETVLKFLVFWLEHARWARIAFTKDESPQRIIGFHRMGKNGSVFFKSFIETLFQLTGKKVSVDAQETEFSFVVDTR